MGASLFLAENVYDETLFTDHSIVAESDQTGHEAFRVGNARRHPTDYWTSDTDNAATWIRAALDTERAFDTVALDRGHNLDGHEVELQASGDASTWWDVVSETLPSSVGSPGQIASGPGVKTEEGAWLRRFDVEAARYVRLRVPAMGAGLRPQITGLWVGLAWEPEFGPVMPYSPARSELMAQVTVSGSGWAGMSPPADARRGDVGYRLDSFAEYDLGRYHLESLAFRGKPFWWVPDLDRPERAMMAQVPPGAHGFRRESGWGYWQVRFEYRELGPLQTWEPV